MNEESDTNARVRTFFFLVIVFGIALFVLSIMNQAPKKAVYLPVISRPTTLSQSQVVYPPPHASQVEKPARAGYASRLASHWVHVPSWQTAGSAWSWV